MLSIRSEDAWVKSMMSTVWHAYTNNPPESGTTRSSLSAKYNKLCWGDDFPDNGRGYYQRHTDLVRSLEKGRRFLEWDVRDGWGPLCEFLDMSVPDVPFPRHDDWILYKKEVEGQSGNQQA